jgi:hypothetical protein
MAATRKRDPLTFAGPPEKPPPNPWMGVVMLLLLALALMGSAYGVFWVWLNSGPRPTTVPDVVGIDEPAAKSILARRGLNPKVAARQAHERIEAGRVIRTFPEADRRVKQGRSIEMIVSEGSAWTWVPDVTEMSLARAREKLKEADLSLGSRGMVKDSRVPPGYVARQRPDPNTRVRRGSLVDVFVAERSADEPARVKYAEVEVSVPTGGGSKEVRIVVEDEDGERVAYRRRHDPGTQFTQTVAGRGGMTVRVFVDDRLIQEKTF